MSSTPLGAEGLISEVIQYMTANLAATLADVDQRYATPVGLEDVTEWRLDDPLSGRLPNKLPVGWVVIPETLVDAWNGNYDHYVNDLMIWVLIRDSQAERLRTRIYRTMQAIWETMKAAHYERAVTWSIIDTPIMEYSETLVVETQVFMSDARLRLRLAVKEDVTP